MQCLSQIKQLSIASLGQDNSTIELNQLESGWYFLRITSKNKYRTEDFSSRGSYYRLAIFTIIDLCEDFFWRIEESRENPTVFGKEFEWAFYSDFWSSSYPYDEENLED